MQSDTILKEGSIRVLIETLRLCKDENRVEVEDIASAAKASESFARSILASSLGEIDGNWVSLGPGLRIKLAMNIAQAGRLRDSARALTWQEFEQFAVECLEEAGYQTEKNVRVKGDSRAWQIDVVGFRGGLVLCIDCKHWNTPGYVSRFKLAADHQRMATQNLLMTFIEKMIRKDERREALPVILTLSEPRIKFLEKVVLVSVDQLPSFLSGLTPYDDRLPFISLPSTDVENPMSHSS